MMMSSSRPLALLARSAMALAVGSLLFACRSESEGATDGASDLIGGQEGISLPATVRIGDDCTAAKVGPRHLLTAAHCVVDLGSMQPLYDTAHPLTVTSTPGAAARTIQVADVLAHPAYAQHCARTLCSVPAVVAKLDAPDVAIIVLATDLDGVATVRIDPRPLRTGDAVIIEGFGCTAGVHVDDTRQTATMKAAETVIVAPDAALHDGSFVQAKDEEVYSGNYALTAGPGAGPGHAGLCPGDSGGPLYARVDRRSTGAIKNAQDLVVVGVNANYTLRPDGVDTAGLPVTNWHTRVDGESRNHVAQWLAGVVPQAN